MIKEYLKLLGRTPENQIDSSKIITKIALALVSVILLILGILSLRWHMVHDSPIMLYASFLMNSFDYIPYRDFFDMNMPGIHLFDSVFIRLFGLSNLGYRIGDLLYLAAIMAATRIWMGSFGKNTAWFGAVVFGIAYLMKGPTMSFQREFIILLPISMALCISTISIKINDILKYTLLGFFFGIAATIKPHAIIGLPLVTIFLLLENHHKTASKSRRLTFFIKNISYVLLGLLIPFAACLIYLQSNNALSPFLDIVKNYWPLYNNMTGYYKTIEGLEKTLYLMSSYLNFGDLTLWFIPCTAAFYITYYVTGFDAGKKRKILLLAGLAFIYSIYPIFAGKFWPYHWLIMMYFLILLGSLCLISGNGTKPQSKRLFPIILFLIILIPALRPSDNFMHNIISYSSSEENIGFMENIMATEIADYMNKHLQDGDLAQPLDWTGGAIHAMLISKAKIATPFIYDFHFYHHLSNPYILNLRREFISHLRKSNPKYIIQIFANRPWPYGKDTDSNFDNLIDYINSSYSPAVERREYIIYVRK